MARKGKKIVWHKKRGKMVPSSLLRPHGAEPAVGATEGRTPRAADRARRVEDFKRRLAAQIRRATRH